MILICTPTKDSVSAGFTFDLVRLIQETPDAYFTISQGSLLPNQRTSLVKLAQEAHVSHVLFIDSDMRFPQDTIKRLLEHKLDIVGANCAQRGIKKTTTGISSKNKTGIEEVKKIGFGVTLIRMDVFIKTPTPWFATPFDGKQFVGEDIFFCRKITEAGFKIFVDHDLSQEVKHSGIYDFGIGGIK